jgi:hypothetical protein
MEVAKMKKQHQRILGRTLAKELSLEELGIVSGADTIVTARSTFNSQAAVGGDDSPSGPPVSTLVATLPDYHEDQ